jgi:hypothetical protein
MNQFVKLRDEFVVVVRGTLEEQLATDCMPLPYHAPRPTQHVEPSPCVTQCVGERFYSNTLTRSQQVSHCKFDPTSSVTNLCRFDKWRGCRRFRCSL